MARERKAREPIPGEIEARLMFRSARTCCICRRPGRPLQFHHLDEDPGNNDERNLAVLCLDCHDLTQVRGGFGRKLKAPEVVLNRDDWHARVERRRNASDLVAVRNLEEVDRLLLEETSRVMDGGEREKSAGGGGDGLFRVFSAEVAELQEYIRNLPAYLGLKYREAQARLDAGTTVDMGRGYMLLREFLEEVANRLTAEYPQKHFGEIENEKYLKRRMQGLVQWHVKRLEPDGPHTGGSIIRVELGYAIVAELEVVVAQLVYGLAKRVGLNMSNWSAEWDAIRGEKEAW